MSRIPVCPPLPPARVRHYGNKIDAKGRVSALCFHEPHAIDMRRESWSLTVAGVTCPKCLSLMALRGPATHESQQA